MSEHPATTRDLRLRIGPGRAAIFGIVSVAAPFAMHGASASLAIVAFTVLTLAFASCSFARSSIRRQPGVLVVALLVAQLLVHLTFGAAGHQTGPEHDMAAASHASHHMPMPATKSGTPASGSSNAAMLLAHAGALLAGFVTLMSLERRAARLIADGVRRICALVVPGHERPTYTCMPASGPAPEFALAARSVRGRCTRLLASGRPRRGPPRRARLLVAASH